MIASLAALAVSFNLHGGEQVKDRWKSAPTYDGPFAALREAFMVHLSGVNTDASALVAGLALGDTSLLSQSVKDQMRVVSLTHLTAVSGANCAIVVGLLFLVLSRFPISRVKRVSLALGALIFYVLLVGPQPSVLRAGVMAGIVLLSTGFGRGVVASSALALTVVLLLIANPMLAIDFGFQLSVLATLGILELAPLLARYFARRLPNWLALALAVSMAAQLVCLPVLLQLQPGLSTYSIPANLLAEPLVAPITILGILACLAVPFAPWITTALTWVASLGSWAISLIAGWLANLPSATISWATGGFGFAIAVIAVVAIYVYLRSTKHSLRRIASITVLGIVGVTFGGCTSQTVRSLNWPPEDWSVISCDVGQGDATFLRSKGQIALIDVGKNPQPILGCLHRLHLNSIDLLVLTHYDMDHVGGIDAVLKTVEIRQALITGFKDTRPAAGFIYRELRQSANNVSVAETGLQGNLGDFTWQVLSPHHDALEAKDSNDGSVTMLFSSPQLEVLTLADLGERGQTRLLSEAAGWLGVGFGATPVLVKVSHHGSSDQSVEFYRRIRPTVALISVGANNDYGHPTQKTLTMLIGTGAQIYRTDLEGGLSVSIGRDGLRIATAGRG